MKNVKNVMEIDKILYEVLRSALNHSADTG